MPFLSVSEICFQNRDKTMRLFSVSPKQWKAAIPPFSFKGNTADHQRKAYPALPLFLNVNISSFLYKSLLTIFCFVYKDYVLTIQFPTALCPLSCIPFPFFFFSTFPSVLACGVLVPCRLQFITYKQGNKHNVDTQQSLQTSHMIWP